MADLDRRRQPRPMAARWQGIVLPRWRSEADVRGSAGRRDLRGRYSAAAVPDFHHFGGTAPPVFLHAFTGWPEVFIDRPYRRCGARADHGRAQLAGWAEEVSSVLNQVCVCKKPAGRPWHDPHAKASALNENAA